MGVGAGEGMKQVVPSIAVRPKLPVGRLIVPGDPVVGLETRCYALLEREARERDARWYSNTWR
jgi:hypothetical protein